MEINVREKNGVTIFDIQGDLSGSNTCDLESKLDAHIASKTDDVKILLNFKQVTRIDIFGLIIVSCAERDVRRKKGHIAYLKSNSRVCNKALKIFAPYKTEDKAIASFK